MDNLKQFFSLFSLSKSKGDETKRHKRRHRTKRHGYRHKTNRNKKPHSRRYYGNRSRRNLMRGG